MNVEESIGSLLLSYFYRRHVIAVTKCNTAINIIIHLQSILVII